MIGLEFVSMWVRLRRTYPRLFRGLKIASILGMTTLFGTLGLVLIEGWSAFDAAYMVIITLTTIGYGEVHPLSHNGRLFMMFYTVFGLGIGFYGVASLGEIIFENQILIWLGKRRMENSVSKLSGHYVICGYGRMGKQLFASLVERDVQVVVIDRDEENVERLMEDGHYAIFGDATEDSVLERAGAAKASGLATVLGSDAENLYVVLSARMLNSDMQIISRASQESATTKLYRAGATQVVSPFKAGAAKMKQFMVNTKAAELVDWFSAGGVDFELSEYNVDAQSPYLNKALKDIDLIPRGIIAVATKHVGDQYKVPPDPNEILNDGDTLLILGKMEVINDFLGGA